jgi:hypothetical protein
MNDRPVHFERHRYGEPPHGMLNAHKKYHAKACQ